MKILRMTSDFCVNLAACAVLGLKWCDSRITYIIVYTENDWSNEECTIQ